MTPFEMARILGMRALKLTEGAEPNVVVVDPKLKLDPIHVAAMELDQGELDCCVERDGVNVHVRELIPPPDLKVMLDTRK